MSLKFNMGGWNRVFAVPHDLIEKHIKLCSGNELKFLLWLLANPEKEITKEIVAKATAIPLVAIDDCIDYWVQEKILDKTENELTPHSNQNVEYNVQEIGVPKTKEKPMNKMLRPDSVYIAKRIKESQELEHVFSHTEAILGKVISPSLAAVLVIAYDDYSLPFEVIVMIISYCVSVEKTSTNYIENVVKNWYNNGITTLELAEEKIRELKAINDSWKKMVSVIGIPYRRPVKAEEDLAVNAVSVMKFSDEMIKLCYEKCILGTGKFQAKYMLKIFQSWYEKKLTNVSQVAQEDMQKLPQGQASNQTSYDINEFYKLNVFNLGDED